MLSSNGENGYLRNEVSWWIKTNFMICQLDNYIIEKHGLNMVPGASKKKDKRSIPAKSCIFPIFKMSFLSNFVYTAY